MYKFITEKQEKLLSKYLSKEYIKKIKKKPFEEVCSFINLIVNTSDISGNFCRFDITNRYKPTELEYKTIIKSLEKKINSNIENYSGILDEHFGFREAYVIPGYDKITYKFEQTWCKGMSSYINRNSIFVYDDGTFARTTYDVLLELNIMSISSFMIYLQKHNFDKKIYFDNI